MASAISSADVTARPGAADVEGGQHSHDATPRSTLGSSDIQTQPTPSKQLDVLQQPLTNPDHGTSISPARESAGHPPGNLEQQLATADIQAANQPCVAPSDVNDPTQTLTDDHDPHLPTSADEGADAGADADVDADQYSDLHVDSQDSDDADSALGMSLQSSTASLRTSLRESVEEHGRTYHKYKQGKYYLPNDEIEQDRLDLQHHLFLLSLDDKLNLAPVVNPQLVLDIGTGTGIWAMDFATQHPSAKVIGTDLSAIQPAFVPSNCQFEVDDAEDDWAYTQKFDFIHGRALFSCFKDPRAVFQKAYDALAPGGYFEIQDVWIKPHSHDGTLNGTNLERWHEVLTSATEKLGRDWQCPPKYVGWFRDVGFEDVVERRLQWPQNPWPRGAKNKLLGMWALADGLDAVASVSTALFTRVLGMSPEEVELTLVGVRKDMRNRAIHTYYPM
jgi:SAM-dependent methyltransferase